MSLIRYAVFGFVVMVLLALDWILVNVVLGFFGIAGTLGLILSWGFASILGGVLIVKVGMKFR